MFLTNQKGPENIPAIVAEDHYARDFYDAIDQCMIRKLCCGLDRPDYSHVWVPVPKISSESFSFHVTVHCSWMADAADFISELRWAGVECTDPVLEGETICFTMRIQPSNGKMSPSGNGRPAPVSVSFKQIPCPW